MFAIDHAATALLVKRRFPSVSLVPLLIAVQAVELLWVVLNLVGVESVTTGPVVASVADIHLTEMPYSHSVATSLVLAAVVWLAPWLAGRRPLAWGLALAVLSHLALDLLTHDRDIVLAPWLDGARYGTGLYAAMPGAAFLLELGYGVLCWWVFDGSASLFAVVIGFNLANVSFFFPSIPGPERWLAGRPNLLVTLILVQIVVTLAAVGWAARRRGATGRRES